MHPFKEILAIVGFFTLVAIAIVLCYLTVKGAVVLP